MSSCIHIYVRNMRDISLRGVILCNAVQANFISAALESAALTWRLCNHNQIFKDNRNPELVLPTVLVRGASISHFRALRDTQGVDTEPKDYELLYPLGEIQRVFTTSRGILLSCGEQ